MGTTYVLLTFEKRWVQATGIHSLQTAGLRLTCERTWGCSRVARFAQGAGGLSCAISHSESGSAAARPSRVGPQERATRALAARLPWHLPLSYPPQVASPLAPASEPLP
eukprot:3851092-Prymnesium_polylepis.1